MVREARNYADPDILAPRWLRVSDTPFDAPYKATKGYGRQMHPTTVSYDAPDGFQISPDRGTHYDEPQEASPSRLPHQLSPDRGGVSLTAPEFFQPTEHPPLKETRYHKVQYDRPCNALLEHKCSAHTRTVVKGAARAFVAPTPRPTLLPSARARRRRPSLFRTVRRTRVVDVRRASWSAWFVIFSKRARFFVCYCPQACCSRLHNIEWECPVVVRTGAAPRSSVGI